MQSDNFDEILQDNIKLENNLMEKCDLGYHQQLSFKYFVKSLSIPKLLSKVS